MGNSSFYGSSSSSSDRQATVEGSYLMLKGEQLDPFQRFWGVIEGPSLALTFRCYPSPFLQVCLPEADEVPFLCRDAYGSFIEPCRFRFRSSRLDVGPSDGTGSAWSRRYSRWELSCLHSPFSRTHV
jgi:hypothetical protein